MTLRPPAPDPDPEDTFTTALGRFNATSVKTLWAKALARRVDDPENAITLARTVLESVCKHILDGTSTPYTNGARLPDLFRLTTKALDLAPSPGTEPIFTGMLNGCTEVVRGVAALRNALSDSHGQGKHSVVPDWRHAELAINLSGAMSTYLLAVWENRQPTVAEILKSHLEATDHKKPLGDSQRATLRRIRDESSLRDKIGAWLTPDDVIEYCRERIKDVSPSTISQDLSFLTGALSRAKVPSDAIRLAKPFLLEQGWIGKSKERLRRPRPAHIERVISHFREMQSHGNTLIPMATLIEFAATSGRKLGEITALKWADVNVNNRTCVSRGKQFRLIGRAWDIVADQPRTKEKIFPYNTHSASHAFTKATRKLGLTKELVFNDLRLEAICRLLQMSFGIHEVSEITGQQDHNVIARIKRIFIDRLGEEPAA